MIELPSAPTPNEGETPAAFDLRHLQWWREGDMAVRVACHNTASAFGAQIAPTAARLADAWDAFDVRLGELAAALATPASTGDGVSEPTLLEAMRISRGVDGE